MAQAPITPMQSVSNLFKGYTNPFSSLFKAPTAPAPTPTATKTPIYPTPTGAPIPATTPATPQITASAPKTTTAPVARQTTPVAPVLPTTPPATTPMSVQTPPTLQAPTPVMPEVSNEARQALDLAEKAYAQALKMTPDELTTQEDIDKLIESTKLAYQGTRDKTIPMEFITGQLASIENRALNLAEPLERKLARLQAQRTSSLESSKFALDRATKAVDVEREMGKFTIERADKKFEQDFAIKKAELDQINSDREYALSEKKFLEDQRQFGLQYALQAREAAAKEAETTGQTVQAQSDVLDNLAMVREITNSPHLDAIFGLKGPTALLPQTALVRNQVDNLIAALSLENRQKLKGSGAISDFEAKMLSQASTVLTRGLSNKDAVKVLNQIKGAFSNAAGLNATVKLTDPKSGKSEVVSANRSGIDEAIRDGLTVEYQ